MYRLVMDIGENMSAWLAGWLSINFTFPPYLVKCIKWWCHRGDRQKRWTNKQTNIQSRRLHLHPLKTPTEMNLNKCVLWVLEGVSWQNFCNWTVPPQSSEWRFLCITKNANPLKFGKMFRRFRSSSVSKHSDRQTDGQVHHLFFARLLLFFCAAGLIIVREPAGSEGEQASALPACLL